jgi:hypothetical protein
MVCGTGIWGSPPSVSWQVPNTWHHMALPKSSRKDQPYPTISFSGGFQIQLVLLVGFKMFRVGVPFHGLSPGPIIENSTEDVDRPRDWGSRYVEVINRPLRLKKWSTNQWAPSPTFTKPNVGDMLSWQWQELMNLYQWWVDGRWPCPTGECVNVSQEHLNISHPGEHNHTDFKNCGQK